MLVHFQVLPGSRYSFEGGIAKHCDPSVHIRLQIQPIQQITIRYFSSSLFVIGGLIQHGNYYCSKIGGETKTRNDGDVGIMP
jgi:hypothetical protein